MQCYLTFSGALAATLLTCCGTHAADAIGEATTAPKLIAPQTSSPQTSAAAPRAKTQARKTEAPRSQAAKTQARKTTPSKSAAATASTGKYLLRYKFAMGEVLRYQVRESKNLRTTIDNSTQQVEMHSNSVKAWKITDVLPNGQMEFMHVVESVKMSNKHGDHPANNYDSTVDKSPPRGFEQPARAVGVPLLAIRIAPNGEVTAREEKQAQGPHAADMPITLVLPREPVAVGQRWSHTYDVPATRQSQAKMVVRTRRVCKLRQVRGGVATIDVQYQILTPVDPFVRAQLIDRLTDGTIRFDLARGRIIEQEHSIDKRVLGFRGNASSVHLVARMQERLIPAAAKIAQAPANKIEQTSAAAPR
jgi:hypothetical protein